MKKLVKKKNKRGFTLLEVMLATCIMTILSAMIMKGFLSTMNYAHNNNVYNKMGAKNYENAIGKVTSMVAYGKGEGLQNRIEALEGEANSDSVEYKFIVGGGGVKSINMSVKKWEYDDNTGVNITAKHDGQYNESSSVSHRHSYFFQPTNVKCSGKVHKVRYCVVPADKSLNGWYCRDTSCANYNKKIA